MKLSSFPRLELKSFFPTSLAAQMVLVIMTALVIAQILAALILYDAHRSNMYNSAQWQLIRRTVVLTQELVRTPRIFHESMVRAASMPRSRFTISSHPILPPPLRPTLQDLLVRKVEQGLGPLFNGHVRIHMSSHSWRQIWADSCSALDESTPLASESSCGLPPGRNEPGVSFIAIAIQLPNKSWLNLIAEAPVSGPLAARQTVIFLIIASALVLLTIAFMVNRITSPMKALSSASNRLGRGEQVDPLPEAGPDDVRKATRAFNEMNERINRFVADRTNMLAALTHDLRTPITTMRLRCELLPESPDRNHLLATVDEMAQMAEATLTFARDNAIKEPSRKVNLDALLDSMCEDLMEIGLKVSYADGPDVTSSCRPVSLRRAIRNLIENAVKYGQCARVSMTADKSYATVIIDDDGPGVSEEDKKRIFEPFVRLENSRSRETGGIGLGMAIARNIIHAHGGQISLNNRLTSVDDEGGLRISITLPL